MVDSAQGRLRQFWYDIQAYQLQNHAFKTRPQLIQITNKVKIG